MGWFWQSGIDAANPGAGSFANRPPAAQPPASAPSSPGATDDADREIAKFWEMLQDEVNPGAKKTAPPPPIAPESQQATAKPSQSSWLPWGSSSATTTTGSQNDSTGPRAIPLRERSAESIALSEASLPTTMSCRDAFDYAWHCHTAGSQWNAVYRYGGVRSCTQLWDDFWFCMRTRSFAPDARADAIKAHYRAKEAAKYGGGQASSEDVWEGRDRLIEPGTAFHQKFDAPQVDDAQMQREEIRRRQDLRKGLGYEDKS